MFKDVYPNFELFVVNAHALTRMPGRMTDQTDAEWIDTLMQDGLLQWSFIADRPQRELRDLARYRLSLVQEHSALPVGSKRCSKEPNSD